jgi:CHAT domain-containing protein/tetratricopeptide (TPR) repeat protein
VVAALFILVALQGSVGDAVKPGKTEGVVSGSSLLLETLGLEAHGTPPGSVRAESFFVQVPSAGSWTLEMRSYSFDSYLVLRDGAGKVLAENDDGPVGWHARLAFQADPNSRLQVDAAGIHNGTGPFTLELREGKPEAFDSVALAEARIVDGEALISYQRETQGPWLALATEQTGRMCLEAGKFERAETLARDALELWQGMDNSEKEGEAWVDLGHVLLDRGGFDSARLAFEMGLELYATHRTPGSNDLLSIQGSIAETWISMGRYARAEELLRPALENARFATDANLFLVPGLEDALGRTLQFQGAFFEARPLLESALLAREIFADQNPEPHLLSLNNLGLLEQEMGMLHRARALYEEALSTSLFLLRAKDPLTLQVRNNLATVMRMEGNLDGAEIELEKVYQARRAVLGDSHSGTLETKTNLAAVRMTLGKFEEAREGFESILQILQSDPRVHPKRTLAVQSHRARIFNLLGDPKVAALLQSSLEFAREHLGNHHPMTASARLQFAAHLMAEGELQGASRLARQAAESFDLTFGQGHPYGAVARQFLATSRVLQGDPAAAWGPASQAVEATSDHLVRLYSHMPEPDRVRVRTGFHSSLYLLLSIARLLPDKQPEAFAALLDSRGRIHRTFSDWSPAADNEEEAGDLVRDLVRVQGELSVAVLGKVGRDLVAEKEALASLRQERLRLERALLRARPASSFAETPGLSEIGEALPPESALVVLSVHPVLEDDGWKPARVEAWILVHGASPVLVDLGPAEPIRRLIKDMTDDFRGAEPIEGAARNPRREIHAAVWKPLGEALQGAELIFLSPDSFLGSLPFEVLEDDQGRFLLEEHRFAYLPDPSILARPPKPEPTGESLLSVGGVLYQKEDGVGVQGQKRGASGRATWDFLENTAPESLEVQSFHGLRFPEANQTLLNGSAADEGSVKEAMQGASYLHLATHGWAENLSLRKTKNSLWKVWKMDGNKAAEALLEEKYRAAIALPSLLSFLVLAGANDPVPELGEDGYLTAEEISFLDLGDCRLAVLSACMTSIGQHQAEEGMSGLQRGFLRAGARRVISTLWMVRDLQTQELMTNFYVWMWEYGLSPFDALTLARRELLANQRRDSEVNPRDWGAFIFSGDWR